MCVSALVTIVLNAITFQEVVRALIVEVVKVDLLCEVVRLQGDDFSVLRKYNMIYHVIQ